MLGPGRTGIACWTLFALALVFGVWAVGLRWDVGISYFQSWRQTQTALVTFCVKPPRWSALFL